MTLAPYPGTSINGRCGVRGRQVLLRVIRLLAGSASANCFNAALALLWPLWLYGYFPLSVSLKPPTAF